MTTGDEARSTDDSPEAWLATERFFAGPGEVRARCREIDWAATPLGPVGAWRPSLRTAAGICLDAAVPSFVWWGPELIQLYNDAALAVVRAKHPEGIGAPARVAWADIWPVVGGLLEGVLATGEAVRGDDLPMLPERGGPHETAWFTFSYGPVRDEGGAVAGVFCTALETTERVRAENALREREEQYRSLFETMDEGFALCELVRDAGGRVVDYRYLELNPALVRHGGIAPDALRGRRATEAFPTLDRWLIETYARVVAERESVVAEHYFPHVDRWLRINAFPRGGDRFAVLYDDVTERKRAEAALRASEARQAFLLELSDALRPLADPIAIQVEAARVLGRHLGASRAMYAEVEADDAHFVVHRDYTDGVPSLAGRHLLDAFGPAFIRDHRAGRTLTMSDAARDERVGETRLAAFAAARIGAFVGVPLVKGGRLAASLSAHFPAPHHWTPAEVALVEETAERTWAAVERARAEAALRESRALLATVFEVLPVGIGAMDAAGTLVLANPEMRRYLPTGLMPSRDQARTARWRAWYPNGRRVEGSEFPGSRALRGESVLSGLEMLYAPDDGGEVWTRVTAVPTRDAHGQVTGAVCVVTDIDALKRSAEAFRASEGRYRLIVEGARDYAIFTTDPGGRIESWSPGAEAVFGWTAAEAIGRSFVMTFTPEDRARAEPEAELETARRDGIAPDVRWHFHKDGARVFIEGTTRPLHDDAGRLRGFLKIGQDVTRRRRTEDALRASEGRYRTLVENIRDYAIFLIDPAGVIAEWTTGGQQVTGYSADEVLGRHFSLFFTPEDVAAGLPDRELAEATATGRAESEGWRIRKDGTRFWADEIATAIHDAGGRVTGFTRIARDLTERRLVQQAAERARTEAGRIELRRRLAEAEEAERRRLARELHDQLGQHLAALTLGLDQVKRIAGSGSPAEPRLAQLEELARAMTRDARHLALELRPPELDDIGLESALETYVEQWAGRYGIAADVAITGLRERSLPDEAATTLYRIVQEALTNVARHAEASHVSVIVEKSDGEVRLIIEDDGRGFDVDATIERARAERRLGLAGMRERAALIAGGLIVESSPGAGATLYVRIPVPRARPAARRATPRGDEAGS